MRFSAQIFNNVEMISKLTPLTSDEARQFTLPDRIIPTSEQSADYLNLRMLMKEWCEGKHQVSAEVYKIVSQKLEDYRCNYDWRDQTVTGKDGRVGLVNAAGEDILLPFYYEIPVRYASINCALPYIPVVREGKYALASTKGVETCSNILASPYEYDDAFPLPFSDGRYYAVRHGDKWRILQPFVFKPHDGIEPLCDYIIDNIYPALAGKSYNVIGWPVESSGKWGLLLNNRFIAPEYDDFSIDFETEIISLIRNGEVVKTIDNADFPF